MSNKPLYRIDSGAGKRMLGYLPRCYDLSRTMRAIMQSQGAEIDRLRIAIDETLLQFFVATATWGLDIWERELKLKKSPSDELEVRRARIITKLMALPIMTQERMKQIANQFVPSKTTHIEHIPKEYAFRVILPVGEFWFRDLIRAINDAKPAHLEAIYEAWFREHILKFRGGYSFLFSLYPFTNEMEMAPQKGEALHGSLPISSEYRLWMFGYLISSSTSETTTAPIQGEVIKGEMQFPTWYWERVFGYPQVGERATADNYLIGGLGIRGIRTSFKKLILHTRTRSRLTPFRYPMCGQFIMEVSA